MLKKVLIALVVIIAGFLAFAATRPDSYTVERSATVMAPPDVVFAAVNDFHRWGEWSPWDKLEPTVLKRTFGGSPSGLGATYAWVGDKTGEGKMAITDSKPGSHVGIALDFIKPFASKSQVDFTLEPASGGTQVRWAMSGQNNFMSKTMSVFMSMDKMIGSDFEKGLADLKAVSEAEAKKEAAALQAKTVAPPSAPPP
jgi:carbon monoxide dehydrogenase subunit G